MIEVHHRRMSFTRQALDDRLAGHTGYVAGRYRDGAYSDIWTDVRRCAFATFTAYAPACSCGWRGAGQPVTTIAYISCRRAWARDHVVPQHVDLPAEVYMRHDLRRQGWPSFILSRKRRRRSQRPRDPHEDHPNDTQRPPGFRLVLTVATAARPL